MLTLPSRDNSFGGPFLSGLMFFRGMQLLLCLRLLFLPVMDLDFQCLSVEGPRFEVIKAAEELKFKAKKQVSLSAELPQELVQSRLCIAEEGTKYSVHNV